MDTSHTFKVRSRIFRWVLVGIMAIFIVRLFYLQVIQHDYYVSLADQEQLKRLVIPAKRGEIFALSGNKPIPLVMNQTVYTAFVDPSEVSDPKAVETMIKAVAGGNIVDGLSGKIRADNRYQKIATGLNYKQAKLIKAENLHGVGLQSGTARVYPEGSLASQTLGFVNLNGDGVYGVEQGLDSRLRGKDGLLQSVTDVSNVPLTIGTENINKPATNGENIVLSIDRNVQAYAEQALMRGVKRTGSEDASVIVMNAQTGHVLAMANMPSYNPDNYGTAKDSRVFNNNTVSYPYEPGSVMKTFTIATAIDKGVITPSSTYYNTGSVRVGDFTIHNALQTNYGRISYQTVLDNSLNTGSVEALKQLGGDSKINYQGRKTLYDYYYNKFRLGRPSGIEVAGAVSGQIISPEAQEGNSIRYANMTFGQGLDVTMLEVAAGFSSIVNGGTYHKPSVLAGTMRDGEFIKASMATGHRVIKPETSREMREMIYKTRQLSMNIEGDKGYYVGGKTGTSQAIVNGKYVFSQTIGTYIGFGGSKAQTKYVIMVRVAGKNRQFEGGRDAKPIFTEVSNWMLSYLKIQPRY